MGCVEDGLTCDHRSRYFCLTEHNEKPCVGVYAILDWLAAAQLPMQLSVQTQLFGYMHIEARAQVHANGTFVNCGSWTLSSF